jgi:hygromycin-B 4-O-kinase
MVTLLNICPEDRSLVHGDYGFDNVLAADGRITAVLDWPNAQYGDFLYDVAWLDFWQSGFAFRDLCAAHYGERGIAVPNYAERILCYQCAIALNVLRFFAKRQNEEAYRWTRQTMLSRLG